MSIEGCRVDSPERAAFPLVALSGRLRAPLKRRLTGSELT